jgi:predicted Zn-dependent protease
MSKFLVCVLSSVLLISLVGCTSVATQGDGNSKPSANQQKDESVFKSIDKANELYLAKKPTEAEAELKRIAALFPNNKSPWLRMAQVSFEAGAYSDAINKAQEVLKRDPQDKVANSTIVVSGLRLAVKSLSDLRTQNNEVTPNLKNDAEELAKTLRESLGEASILTKDDAAKTTQKPRPKKKVSTSTNQDAPSKPGDSKASKSGNPFEVLN